MADFDMADLQRRMDGAIQALGREFGGLRTGRASTSLLEPITVEAYGSQMPMNQVGNIAAPEPRLLTVQVWDQGMVKSVEKAIRDSDLGLNPQTDGNLVRVPIPDLSEERRIELKKVAAKYAEQLKKMEKDGDISKDQHRDLAAEIQEATDGHIKEIDGSLEGKEKEIMQV